MSNMPLLLAICRVNFKGSQIVLVAPGRVLVCKASIRNGLPPTSWPRCQTPQRQRARPAEIQTLVLGNSPHRQCCPPVYLITSRP